jgi:hypothetical protein
MEHMSSNELLRIYLRDHHAAAVAGAELAKRSAKSNQGTPFESTLEGLRAEIDADMSAFEDIMSRLGVQPAKGKDGAAWVAEKMGRLKLNGSLTSYSPLSRVIEFEGLALGVEGKLSMWRSLQQLSDARLNGTELGSLVTRGESQLRLIHDAKKDAVDMAFGSRV